LQLVALNDGGGGTNEGQPGLAVALRRAQSSLSGLSLAEAFTRSNGRKSMPKDAHSKGAEHHENAAKMHRTAAEHHSKGEHSKGNEHSGKAQEHSKTARQHSETAHQKSSQSK
jgi:hypothetical protein